MEELVGFCKGFPLALGIIAGRALAHPHVPLAEFAAELRELGLDALDGGEPAAGLPAVLSWSYRALTAEQRTVPGLLGIAPGPDISLSAASALVGLPPARTARVLRGLEETSLLGRDAHGRYAMHDLVRPSRSARPSPVPLPTRCPTTRRPWPGSTPNTGGRWPAQRTATARDRHRAAWNLAWALHTFHTLRSHRHDDLAVWRAGLTATEHLRDPATRTLGNPVWEAEALDKVGWYAALVGEFDRARGSCLTALALHRLHHNPDGEADTLDSLGYIDHHTGRHHQAVDHYLRALALLRDLGHPHAALGQDDRARAAWREALELYRYQGRDAAADRVRRQLDRLGTGGHEPVPEA